MLDPISIRENIRGNGRWKPQKLQSSTIFIFQWRGLKLKIGTLGSSPMRPSCVSISNLAGASILKGPLMQRLDELYDQDGGCLRQTRISSGNMSTENSERVSLDAPQNGWRLECCFSKSIFACFRKVETFISGRKSRKLLTKLC